MQSIGNEPSMGPQMYAMKKAIDVQAQSALKVLESAGVQASQQQSSGAALTGVGQKLDIKG